MKKTKLLILIMVAAFTAQAQSVVLEFHANHSCEQVGLDSIWIQNLTQGGRMVLFYPDNIAVFTVSDISDFDTQHNHLYVSQNYPNPFSAQTYIDVHLATPDHVSLSVYDLTGRIVARHEDKLEEGMHRFSFSAGVEKTYILTVTSGKHVEKQIMLQVGIAGSAGSEISYLGASVEEEPKTAPKSADFNFNPGDNLRFSGFVTDVNGNMDYKVINDAPETSREYLFDIANDLPDKPSEISGENYVPENTTGLVYEVEEHGGLTYLWNIPDGWEITQGQGSHAITVAAGSEGGEISVKAENNCGISEASVLSVDVDVPTFELTLYAKPAGGGDVSGEGSYPEGEQVSVAATAGEGWEFVLWTGDTDYINDTDAETATITMPSNDVTLTANFEMVDYYQVSVFAADSYTETPLDSALVLLEKQGNVIDSAWTNTAGQVSFFVSTTETDSTSEVPGSFNVQSKGMSAQKTREKDHTDAYALRVSKNRYEDQLLHFTLHEDIGLDVLLERSNLVLLVVLDVDSLPISCELLLTGDEHTFILTAPGLHVIKSGQYLVHANSGTSYIEEEIEVASSDVDFFFIPEIAELPPEDDLPIAEQLINEALANEDIDQETALIYKVFAAFSDLRLPPEYQGGPVPDTYVTHIQKEAMNQYEQLSPEAQEIIGPFLVPPMYRGSWWHLRHGGTNPLTQLLNSQADSMVSKKADTPPCVPGIFCHLISDEDENWLIFDYIGGDNIKTWYITPNQSVIDLFNGLIEGSVVYPDFSLDQMEKARDLLEAMHVERKGFATLVHAAAELAWDSLFTLGLKRPLPDHIDPLTGNEILNHGGDPRLDIITLPAGASGRNLNMTYSYLNRYDYSPAFIVLTTPIKFGFFDTRAALGATIHETMHAFQYAYMLHSDGQEYEWFMESSANWAIDHVMPWLDFEHSSGVRSFMNTPHLSLNDRNRDRHFAYLWPLFLARKHSPDLIRAILENFQIYPSLEAVDQTLKEAQLGGFEEQWPKFALSLWNREPYDRLAEWDDLTSKAHLEIDIELSLDGATEQCFELDIGILPPLSSKYLRFRVEDDEIRSVLFANGYSLELNWEELEIYGKVRSSRVPEGPQFDGRHTQVLLKYENDGWQPGPYESFDITEIPGAISLEEADDRIKEMVVILSNSHMEQDAEIIGLPPEVEVSNYANYQWEGEGELISTSDGVTEKITIDDIVWTRLDYSDPKHPLEMPCTSQIPGIKAITWPLTVGYELESAQLTWELSGEREEGVNICTYSGYDQQQIKRFMDNMFFTHHHMHPDSDPYRSFSHVGYRPPHYHMASYTKHCINQQTGEETTEVFDHALFMYAIFNSCFSGIRELPPHYVDDDGRTIVIEVNYEETWFGLGTMTGALQLESKQQEQKNIFP